MSQKGVWGQFGLEVEVQLQMEYVLVDVVVDAGVVHHWYRFSRIAKRFIPPVRNTHPYPEERFYALSSSKPRAV